jgi:hypothetical protein
MKADAIEKALDEIVGKARDSRDALDQLERRVSALPMVRTTTAEERRYLTERGWEFSQGKVWTTNQHGGGYVDGELATDWWPTDGRVEKTGELVVPDRTKTIRSGQPLPTKIVEVRQFCSGSARGLSMSVADALVLERKRDREPIPYWSPVRVRERGLFWVRQRERSRDRFDLGPFDSLEAAQEWCDKANQPGACGHCGESGPRDSLTIREFEARTRWMSDQDIYEVAVRIWQNDWMATIGIHHPGRQCPPVPDNVLELTKNSNDWWTADPKKDGKAHDVRKHHGTHLVKRCCDCGRLPQRFVGQAPAPAKPTEGVG